MQANQEAKDLAKELVQKFFDGEAKIFEAFGTHCALLSVPLTPEQKELLSTVDIFHNPKGDIGVDYKVMEGDFAEFYSLSRLANS